MKKNSALHATSTPATAADEALTERRTLDLIAANDELIKNSLSDARTVIENGGTWNPLVHVCHPGGVRSMVIPLARSGPAHKTEVVDTINRLRKELNGYLVIMLVDNLIREENLGNSVPRSPESPLPGPFDALVVTAWGSNGLPIHGMQRYSRRVAGQVLFEEFLWGVPLV